MKKIVVALSMVAFLAACDDSSSASAENSEPAALSSAEKQGRSSSSSVSSADSETLSSSSRCAGASEECDEAISSDSNAESNGSSRSSSSEKNAESSSSEKLSGASSSSAGKAKSSSSVEDSSSSEVTPESSSSETESSSSSSENKINCSALLEGKTDWSWDVPKECRFNPDIDYGTITDSRDGKVYRTVKIGDQVWMAENLNYYDASDLNVKEKSWCFGKKDNGDSTTCDVAGRLYTWAAAIDSVKLATDATNPLDCGYGKECGLKDTVQGVCPNGWHLPSKAEWNTLFTAVGGKSTAGNVLKSQTGWNKNSNGMNVFGFSALPVGYGKGKGDYYVDGDKTLFWSSTEDGNFDAFCMLLSNTVHRADLAELNYNIKGYGFSVRCVKD